MRSFSVFTLLLGALWLASVDEVSAFGCRRGCGGCGGGRCHSRCHHRGCGSCCTSSCCGTSCAPCCGPVCGPAGCVVAVGAINAPATIVVQLPADAVLSVDGTVTTSTSAVRTFVTPALAAGQTYVYTMQARMANGQTSTQQVTFRAGERTTVRFDDAGVAVTQR